MAFSIAIQEDDLRYFTLNSFDFCFGVYGKKKPKAYLFKFIHPKEWKKQMVLCQKEDFNAEDGLDHYIEMFGVILCLPNNSN